jgi:hypothetical protein
MTCTFSFNYKKLKILKKKKKFKKNLIYKKIERKGKMFLFEDKNENNILTKKIKFDN